MQLYSLILFIVLSIPILFYSWPHLRNRRSHGFYRFFIFESELLLILLQVAFWFSDPFSLPQLVSWCLLSLSLVTAIHGFYLLDKYGKPVGDFEATTKLVKDGAYRYIRHPLYASLLFLGWGAFLKNITWLTLLLVLVSTAACFMTAKIEEAECIEKFGEEYDVYMQSTKMFIPFLF